MTDISTSPAPEFFETKPQEPDGWCFPTGGFLHIFGGGEPCKLTGGLQSQKWSWKVISAASFKKLFDPSHGRAYMLSCFNGERMLWYPGSPFVEWTILALEYHSQRRSLLYCICSSSFVQKPWSPIQEKMQLFDSNEHFPTWDSFFWEANNAAISE